MIPIYVFYSMFGFQRTADSIWAAADQMTRGFLIGATAGRTTLTGEGLQHADGHSPIMAATNPAVVSYDPAFAFEIGHIMQDGLRRMYGDNPENLIYYITVYNEPMSQPAEPENVDHEGILRGMHLFVRGISDGLSDDAPRVQLLASGVGVPWAMEAQELLRNDWGVVADVWSVTSWTELRRDGLACDEQRFKDSARTSSAQRPSMGQDMQKGRRTEIEFLNGFVVREGEKFGLACSANAVLTDIVKRVLARAVLSKHGEGGLGQVFRFRKLEVTTKPNVRVYADNAQAGRTPVTITAELSAVQVILKR
jgi:pyruvate dehydrogenase complex dehydrogenase (E1) component